MPPEYDWLLEQCEPGGDPAPAVAAARACEAAGDFRMAAAAYDRAFGLNPADGEVARARTELLDRQAVTEHDLRFRYIPAGSFRMGSTEGEPDERPVHPVELSGFWLTETPVSWADFCRLLGWSAPPEGQPDQAPGPAEGFNSARFNVYIDNQIRLQYCETETTRAIDWHAHDPNQQWGQGGVRKTSQEIFGEPPRRDRTAPWTYERKPMVAVAWQDAVELAEHLSTPAVRYALPTEAEWERAARGGLIGCRYPWGDAPPNPERCDCGRWDERSIRLPRELPPNAYGLYGMSGGVWEWTADWYDAAYYAESPRRNPPGSAAGEQRVLRGGSWADCPEAATVSFRMSRASTGWREKHGGVHTPNVGFRLARYAAGER